MWISVDCYSCHARGRPRRFGGKRKVKFLFTFQVDRNEPLATFTRIVESMDARMFGLDDAEVQKRRRYVVHVRKEIEVGFLSSSSLSNLVIYASLTAPYLCKSRTWEQACPLHPDLYLLNSLKHLRQQSPIQRITRLRGHGKNSRFVLTYASFHLYKLLSYSWWFVNKTTQLTRSPARSIR